MGVLVVRFILVLFFLGLLLSAKVEFHDDVEQVGQLLTLHSELVQFVLSFHGNLLQSVFTTGNFEHTDQTDQRSSSNFNKFLLVGGGDEFLNELQCVVEIGSEAFGLSHEQ